MIELMGEGYLKAPNPTHPLTLLCRRGPFRSVTLGMFADLLRAMGAADLLRQGTDGLLLAGGRGDRMINHYSFYTVFHTPDAPVRRSAVARRPRFRRPTRVRWRRRAPGRRRGPGAAG